MGVRKSSEMNWKQPSKEAARTILEQKATLTEDQKASTIAKLLIVKRDRERYRKAQ